MQDGKTTVICEFDEPREVTLRLPDGHEVSMAARLVSFDSIGAAHPEVDEPRGGDVHGAYQSVDGTVRLTQRIGSELDIPIGEAMRWKAAVEEATGSDDVKSSFLRGRVGYLTVEMQLVHQGVSKNDFLHLILSW
jgi:hypothetical protein